MRRHDAQLSMVVALSALLGSALCVSAARAYSSTEAYVELPASGGGGGRFFTGSPADGYGCSVCHGANPGPRSFPLYVAGLPEDGYTPGQSQEIVLSWPEMSVRWREIRPDPTVRPPPGAQAPAMSMLAELVAESGKGSGVIEIRTATAIEAEQCERTRPNLQPRHALKLYQVRPGIPALQVKPDSAGVLRCEAHRLGQRCVVALTSCGAQQARFVWTAPSGWEGPIWFAAGYVASEALDGTLNGDSVQEIAVPIVQSDSSSGVYEETLRGGCSVAISARSQPSTAPVLSAVWLAVLLRRRRRLAVGVALLACALVCTFAAGCALESSTTEPSSFPAAGLYTPGNTLGASDPTDTPLPGAGLGNRCMPLPAFDPDAGIATRGELSVTYTTQTLEAQYSPKNCTAVWIETPDGAYVAAIEVLGGLVGRPGLFYLADHACLEKLGPDVKTGATLTDHSREHSVRWRGTDFEGKPVADGMYKLFIEVTESDTQPGEFASFDIEKGAQAYEMGLSVPAVGPLVSVSVAWEPDGS